MRLTDQPAYLLHRRAHGERSVLAELWTRDHGRLPAIARQARGGGGERVAALAPFNPLLVGLSGRGEVLTLSSWDVDGMPGMLRGAIALAGMYINELLVRLLARGDAHPKLYVGYQKLLRRLAVEERMDWPLRGFEKQLLDELGYGLQLGLTADGSIVEPDGLYRVDLENGVRATSAEGGYAGSVLLALAQIESQAPTPAVCNQQRKLMRELFLALLGGKPLTTWEWSQVLRKGAG